jgi:hypothetical protein
MLASQPGDRIRLIAMSDDPDPIPPGTAGTVTVVRQHGTWAQVDVAWDNGRTLMLVVPPDQFEVVSGAATKWRAAGGSGGTPSPSPPTRPTFGPCRVRLPTGDPRLPGYGDVPPQRTDGAARRPARGPDNA